MPIPSGSWSFPLTEKDITKKKSYSIQHYKQYSNTKHLVQVDRRNTDRYDALTLRSKVNHPLSPRIPPKWKKQPQNSPKLPQMNVIDILVFLILLRMKEPTLNAILSPKIIMQYQNVAERKHTDNLISTKQRLLWWKDITVRENYFNISYFHSVCLSRWCLSISKYCTIVSLKYI